MSKILWDEEGGLSTDFWPIIFGTGDLKVGGGLQMGLTCCGFGIVSLIDFCCVLV